VDLVFQAHKLAIDAARKSGVKHIFYSSLAFAGDGEPTSEAHVMQAHLDTEKYLASIAAQDPSFTYTVVRIGLYSESFPLYTAFFDLKNPSDEIRIPHDGSGPGIAWAKQDELGEAAAKLMKSYLASPKTFAYINKIILLSGPRVWSLSETAEVLGRVAKKPVKIRQVTVEQYSLQPQVQRGMTYGGGDLAPAWATAFEAIRRGEAAVVTPHLRQLLGREPEPFDQTIAKMV
jgi:nucleoside-diphosphate-sugar epimerase